MFWARASLCYCLPPFLTKAKNQFIMSRDILDHAEIGLRKEMSRLLFAITVNLVNLARIAHTAMPNCIRVFIDGQ